MQLLTTPKQYFSKPVISEKAEGENQQTEMDQFYDLGGDATAILEHNEEIMLQLLRDEE